MDIKSIKELVKIAAENGVETLEVAVGEMTVKIKMPYGEATLAKAEMVIPLPQTAVAAAPVAPVAEPAKGRAVKSPMVGVFYEAASPDSQPFVKVGDKVKKGDVLCIIEAMKLLNEIVSEQEGEVAEVCVQNGQIVEFSQPLFRLI